MTQWTYNIFTGEWEEAQPNPFFRPFSNILTDKDYYDKRKHIVEKITGKKIAITYTSNPNAISQQGKGEFSNLESRNKYVINLTDPPIKEVDMKSAFYHEQGHALWESFVSNGLEICREYGASFVMKRWKELGMMENKDGQERIVFKNKKGQEILPDPILFERFTSLYKSHKAFAENAYMTTFNVLEDQRIESLTSRVWLSTKGMFKELRKNLASTCKTFESPIDKLLAVRFTLGNKVEGQQWHDAIKNVEYTDKFGAIIEVHHLRDDINKWLESQLEENMKKVLEQHNAIANGSWNEKQQTEMNSLSQQLKQAPDKAIIEVEARINKFKAIEKLTNMNPKQMEQSQRREKQLSKDVSKMKENMSKENQEWNNKRERLKELEALKQQQEKVRQEIKSEVIHATSVIANETLAFGENNPLGNHGGCSTHSSSEAEAVMEGLEEGTLSSKQSKMNASREVSQVLSKLQELEEPEKPAHVVIDSQHESRETESIRKLDPTAIRYLKKTFDKIVASRVTKVTENGMEVDVESYIARKQRGYGEFMLGEEPQRGLKVIVSIDGSGSMRYDNRMFICRKMVATMYKAIEGLQHVRLIANVWSASREGEVCITPIRKLDDCKKISLDSHYVFTPTHEALKYAREELSNNTGKKLFIILTDGHPQYYDPVTGDAVATNILTRMARKEFVKLNRICKNSFALGIATHGKGAEELSTVFKKRIVHVKDAEEAQNIVLKKFRQQVIESMRRR